MTNPAKGGCGTAQPHIPIRRRVIVIVLLVLIFPFAATGWFTPEQIVLLLTAIAAIVAAVVRPAGRTA